MYVPCPQPLYVFVAADGSGDQPTIQAAIDAVADGGVVELGDGVFQGTGNRDLWASGREVTIRSQNGHPGACIIDCQGSSGDQHRGIKFYLGETSSTVFEGITIRNAYSWFAGAVFCESGASPVIRDCIFEDNTVDSASGASAVHNGSAPLITGCTFDNNQAAGDGGAIRSYESAFTIENCLFTGNSCSGKGGAVFSYRGSAVTISNCWFEGNYSVSGGGALHADWSSDLYLATVTIAGNHSDAECGGVHMQNASSLLNIAGSTIIGNHGSSACGVYLDDTTATLDNTLIAYGSGGPAIACAGAGIATLTCCDISINVGGNWIGCIAGQLGVNGNIEANPLFCDRVSGDFTLMADSPCTAENNPGCGQIGAWGIGCDASMTVSAEMTCAPSAGTLPFSSLIQVGMTNNFAGLARRFQYTINVTLAGGQYFSNWRRGWQNISAGTSYSRQWWQNIPNWPSLEGGNLFELVIADVTPPPYNLPPYPPAGDIDTDSCTVTGISP